MVRVIDRVKVAKQALATLEELLDIEDVSLIIRDAAIKRFEYTFEAVWKAARHYLMEYEGLDIGSPKGVIRGSLSVGLLNAEQALICLDMTDDRNRTVHTYNSELVEVIFSRLHNYAELMRSWINAVDMSIDEI